jgi:peroxiredoxin
MLGGQTTELATLRGQQATVVLFWHPDRWMARTALTDMQRDIASQFDAKQVAVVGIAVRLPPEAVQVALSQAGATFPQLLDTDGQAFSKVGTATFPRIYVLDPAGKIIWFDIEYSEGTRRELWQTLRYLTEQ